MLSIKSECLNKLILFGEHSLRRACSEYAFHYHEERNHQGLDNRLIEGEPSSGDGVVQCHRRLGGLLKFYDRAA